MLGCLPIDRLVVTFGGHHFWSQIVWCATKSPGDIWDLLRKTEIGNLDMAVSVEQQIFGLKVAIYDVLTMKILQRQRDFSGVEFGDRIWESLPKSVLRKSCHYAPSYL
jgi:hypothetical protein